MATEHVCTEAVMSFGGYPMACVCGHLSASYVLVVDGDDEASDIRICNDCAAAALREKFEATRIGDVTDPDDPMKGSQ